MAGISWQGIKNMAGAPEGVSQSVQWGEIVDEDVEQGFLGGGEFDLGGLLKTVAVAGGVGYVAKKAARKLRDTGAGLEFKPVHGVYGILAFLALTGVKVGHIKPLAPTTPLAWWEHIKTGAIFTLAAAFIGFMLFICAAPMWSMVSG